MTCIVDEKVEGKIGQLPAWFRQDLPDKEKIEEMRTFFRRLSLHTVCEDALCPNMGKCWSQGTATFMILGGICTRACRFCAVKTGRAPAVDLGEPRQAALAVKGMNLRYVVITSVTRDDLADGGAEQFARTIEEIRCLMPQTKIEVLIPDFADDIESLQRVVEAGPDVISHNIETVRRLSPEVRPQAGYDRSLSVLQNLRRLNSAVSSANDGDRPVFIKSGFMVGLGETEKEIVELMKDLAFAGCDMLTIGQYLAPTRGKRHWRVRRFVAPEEFESYKSLGIKLGFKCVMSGPLVRSSYIAEEGYKECLE